LGLLKINFILTIQICKI